MKNLTFNIPSTFYLPDCESDVKVGGRAAFIKDFVSRWRNSLKETISENTPAFRGSPYIQVSPRRSHSPLRTNVLISPPLSDLSWRSTWAKIGKTKQNLSSLLWSRRRSSCQTSLHSSAHQRETRWCQSCTSTSRGEFSSVLQIIQFSPQKSKISHCKKWKNLKDPWREIWAEASVRNNHISWERSVKLFISAIKVKRI